MPGQSVVPQISPSIAPPTDLQPATLPVYGTLAVGTLDQRFRDVLCFIALGVSEVRLDHQGEKALIDFALRHFG